MQLPHYGVFQEVRVCDGCFQRGPGIAASHQSWGNQSSIPESGEDTELQKAIQLSLLEVATKNVKVMLFIILRCLHLLLQFPGYRLIMIRY